MSNQEMELMAHLMRRAGFGATRDELEEYVAKGYETVVEELLHPADPQNMPDDIIRRYHTEQAEMRLLDGDLRANNDFRCTYTTILDHWLGLDAAPIVNGQFEQFDFVEK